MDALPINTAAEAAAYLRGRDLPFVKVGVIDIDGIMRGKYMARDKFESALEKGFGFCDVVLGWDSNDQLYDNTTLTGWHTAYPDAAVRVLPETMRLIPFESDLPFFLGEFDGYAEAVCPRGVAAPRARPRPPRWASRVSAAAEFEFFLFEETPHSVREKGYRDLKNHHARVLRLFGAALRRAFRVLSRACSTLARRMDFEIEGLHTETGPGVLEAAIRVDDALARRRQGGPVQDLHQDPRAAARLDGDLHGEMVARLAGPVGPSARLA